MGCWCGRGADEGGDEAADLIFSVSKGESLLDLIPEGQGVKLSGGQ